MKSYEIAGKLAQEVLSSLRTVIAFGTMKKEINKYEKNLHNAEKMAVKKGIHF